MKKQLSALAVCGAVLVFGVSSAIAQPQPQHHDDRQHQRDDHHWNGNDHRDGMYAHGHRDGWYRRGGHVPAQYRGNTYVVNDWRARRLRAPPRGYHYVRSDNGDFLLVAITTGVIASILAQH